MGGTGQSGSHDLADEDTVAETGPARGRNSKDLPEGTKVGEYVIERQIGEGGMGRVYAATHPVIAKRAAVKVLHPELSMDEEAVQRFIDEARAVNQIGHPNIVDIFSYGQLTDGRCYFVMEWLRGESLRDRMRRTSISLGEALAFIDTIATALEAAHENDIVHRDLKPDNIFLVDMKHSAPQVKLLDFGIAKLLGNDVGRTERTRTGNLLGTPAYMSPEQARGQNVDHRTDIYALGCLAYEMFTASLPFPADNAADMIAKHLFTDPPSVLERNPTVPPELDGLVCAMIAKDPDARPTLAQVQDVVRRALVLVSSPYAPRLATPVPGFAYGQPLTTPLPGAFAAPPRSMPQAVPVPVGPPATSIPHGPPLSTLDVPPRSKKGLVLGLASVLSVGVAIAVAYAMGTKGKAAAPRSERATPTERSQPTLDPPPRPADVVKPDETNVADTPMPDEAKSEATKAADTPKPPVVEKTTTVERGKSVKKPGSKKVPRGTTKNPVMIDDDDPM